MQQNLKNNGRISDRIVGRFAAERKKTVLALCLISLMVFMWVRVLGKKGPRGAEAAFMGQQVVNTVQPSAQSKISFVELPHVEGRHDALTRDFFVVENWRDFVDTQDKSGGNSEEVNVVAKNGFEEVAKLVSEKLKLEVIEFGSVPQAFISGKLLTVGDKMEFSDGVNKYQCEVLRIEKSTVYLRCGSTEVQLKFVQLTEEMAGQ